MWLFVLRCKVEKCILMTKTGFRSLGISNVGWATVALPAGSSNILCVCMSVRVC